MGSPPPASPLLVTLVRVALQEEERAVAAEREAAEAEPKPAEPAEPADVVAA